MEDSSNNMYDCTSFCLGYFVGTSERKQKPPYFTVCRNLSMIVAFSGNVNPMSIEKYDEAIIGNNTEWASYGTDRYKDVIFEPFIRQMHSGNNSLSNPMTNIIRGQIGKQDVKEYWRHKRRCLNEYSRMLVYHHNLQKVGTLLEYDRNWYLNYAKLTKKEMQTLLQNATWREDDTSESEDDDDENDSLDTSKLPLTAASLMKRKRLCLHDYLLATASFGERVKEYFEQQRKEGATVTVTDSQIAVEATEAVEKMMMHVIGVEGDILETRFVDEVIDWIDDAAFVKEEDFNLRAAKGRMYLIESILESSVFSLSDGKIVLEASQMSRTGKKLMKWVQKLCDIQNRMVEDFIAKHRDGQGIEYKPFRPNLMQIVVGKGDATYGRHDDMNPETYVHAFNANKEQEYEEGSLESKLPFDYEQQVVTVVLTVGVQKEATDGHCKVTHYSKKDKNADPITTITKDMGLHIQCHGIQRYCVHDVRPIKVPASGSGVKRIIFSFRETIDWASNEESLSKAFRAKNSSFDPARIKQPRDFYKNVLQDKCYKIPSEEMTRAASGCGKPPFKKPPIKRPSNARSFETQSFMRNYIRDESVKHFPRPGKKVAIPSESRKVLRHYKAVRKLIENKMFLSVKSKGESSFTPYLGTTYELGEVYSTSRIRKDFGVAQSNTQADLYNRTLETPDCMILERWYKNSFSIIRRILKKIKAMGGADWIYELPDGSIEVWFGPKGGNPTTSGQFGQPGMKDAQKEITHRTESFQNIDSNVGLEENDKASAVFHFFVPVDWGHTGDEADAETIGAIKKADEPNRTGQVIYLGLWYFAWSETRPRPRWVDKNFKNTKWLKEKQTLYYCRPLYNARHKPPAHVHDAKVDKMELQIIGDELIAVWMKDSLGAEMNSDVRKNGQPEGRKTDIGGEGHDAKEQGQTVNMRDESIDFDSVFNDRGRDPDGDNSDSDDGDVYSKESVLQEWLTEQIEDVRKQACEPGDDSTEDMVETPVPTGELSVEGFFREAARIGVAAFARSQNHCFYGDNNDQIGYLCGQKWLGLGWVSGANAIPHPIRAYNLQTYVYIEACGVFNEQQNRFVLRPHVDGLTLANLLFRSTVLRTAGTVGWYYLYNEVKKKDLSRPVFIPRMEDMEDYCDFLASHSPLGMEGSMNPYNKCLYHKSLPFCCKRTIEGYKKYMWGVSQTYKQDTVKYFDEGVIFDSREKWLNHVKRTLEEAAGGDQVDATFLASLIIADVEEVLDCPFGEAEEVVYGYGGGRGMEMVETSKHEGRTRKVKPAQPKLKKLGNCKKSKTTYPREATAKVFEYLQRSVSQDLLSCLGLYKDTANGSIHISLNGRLVRITDLDNVACKLSIAQAKTTGSRLCMQNPSLNHIYDFPYFPAWRRFVLTGLRIDSIACQAIDVFFRNGTILFPSIDINFQYHSEDSVWKSICEQMDKGLPMKEGKENCGLGTSCGRRIRRVTRKRMKNAGIQSSDTKDAKNLEAQGTKKPRFKKVPSSNKTVVCADQERRYSRRIIEKKMRGQYKTVLIDDDSVSIDEDGNSDS